MPWKIVKDHSECSDSKPWAVIKQSDGKSVGCHETEQGAKDQLAALNIAESGRLHTNLDTFHTSAMVALYPLPEVAQRLALPDGVPVSELHLTLAYLGESSAIEDVEQLERAVAQFAKYQLPIKARLNGYARFTKTTDEGTNPFVALIDSSYLGDMQRRLVSDLEWDANIKVSREHGFMPHITLAYLPADSAPCLSPSEEMEFTLDVLSLVIGDRRLDVRLTGELTERPRNHTMPKYTRAYSDIAVQNRAEELLNDTSLPVPFVASTEGLKRDGKDLKTGDWLLDRFNTKYGVILFGHDYRGDIALPVGTGKARIEEGKLKIDVLYDTDDEFAMRVRSKAIKGMMAGSVGWDELEDGNELIEFSNVPIGLDPDSLPEIQRQNLRSLRDDIDKLLEEEEPQEEEPVTASDDQPADDAPEPPTDTVRYVFITADQLETADALRAGAVLSSRNRNDLERAIELIQGVLSRAQKADMMDDEDEMPGEEEMRMEVNPTLLELGQLLAETS